MGLNFASELFHAPEVRLFFDVLRGEIINRRNLLLLLPETLDASQVWKRLNARLVLNDFDFQTVSVDTLHEGRPLVASLAESLYAEWESEETPRTLDNFLRCTGLPEGIYLEGYDRLSETGRKAWLDLLERWAQSLQSSTALPTTLPILCLIIPATRLTCDIPKTNVRLAIHWWWDVHSPFETRLLCRLANQEADELAQWREYLLPELAGNDVHLAEFLWDDLTSAEHMLFARLREYAKSKGWREEWLRDLGADELFLSGCVSYMNSIAQLMRV